MNELAGQNLGGYVLEEEIGRGSMGMVYRGKQIALEREVAIKVLPQRLAKDASYIARFIREAQIIARLNHPHIVQIYDAGQQGGQLYFVMEDVQGPTLGSLLRLDESIAQAFAAEYAAQVAEALDSAYNELHVIHRDIKPENLMLDRRGKIKVMDFGLARALGLQQITVAQTLVGSIYYASPEQVQGLKLDNRSDIYALGVVLYEMVTGQRPFTGRSLPEVTQLIAAGMPRPPRQLAPDLDPGLERIILKAMARNRDERYTQAQEMAEELRALHLTAESDPPGGSSRSASPSQTRGGRERLVIHPPRRPPMKKPPTLNTRKPSSSRPENQASGQPGSYQPLPEAATQQPPPPAQATNSSLPEQNEIDALEQHMPPFWQQLQRLLKRPEKADEEESD